MISIHILQCDSKRKFPLNIVPSLIKYFQKTNYSHYAIEVSQENIKEYYDSTIDGTRKLNQKDFERKYVIVEAIKFPKKLTDIDWLDFWSLYKNKPYGFKQIFGLLLKTFKIIKNNPFGAGAKRIICNELVILFLNYTKLINIKDTDSLDLNDTEKLLRELNDFH